MSKLKNSQAICFILQTLINKISRRTSRGFATNLIKNIQKDLIPKYDFLRYIKIKDSFYSEEIDTVDVTSGIDLTGSTEFYNAVKDIIKMTVERLGKTANFFFIKEFQEALDSIEGLNLKERNIDLNLMQFQYIIDRKQEFNIEKSEMMEIIIKSLTSVINRILSEEQTIQIMISSIKKLEKKYDFLKYIKTRDIMILDGVPVIRILSEINSEHSAIVAEAIQKLIENVGKSVDQRNIELFIETFKNELGNENISKIKRMGIDLEHAKIVLLRQGHELIVKKTLEALVIIMSKYTSEDDAVVVLDTLIENLKGNHDVFKYIKINKSQNIERKDVISVLPEINNIESYVLGKAIREIIKLVGKGLGVKAISYIEDFKKYLGEEYLLEIEKIGVNLHFIELKYI